MERGQVHYELFVRRTPQSSWALQLATENRVQALETAEDMLAEGRVAAVRVTKETLDPSSREFDSVTLLTKGAPEQARRKVVRESAAESPCLSPADLLTLHARETIARVLDDWLRRNRVTPFELLHRPDVAEKLEASGTELQHAIQKVAVPESQSGGKPVHDCIRHYQRLADQAAERVISAARKGRFPDLSKESLGEAAWRLADDPEALFLLGGAVAQALASAESWGAKADRLLDLWESAPAEEPLHGLCRAVIEPLLAEMTNARAALSELLGGKRDLGGDLLALACLAAPNEVETLTGMDARLKRVLPELTGTARRLGAHVAAGAFKSLNSQIARRVLTELLGPRRLRPTDPKGEIETLRALAMILTASAGRLIAPEDVQAVFFERSKTLVAADFLEGYLAQTETALGEAEALVRLCENVTGGLNKRQAGRWLTASVTAHRFERDLRDGADSPAVRLAALAALQRSIRKAGLPQNDADPVLAKIGDVGGLIEADARLTAQLARAPAPIGQRLGLLLKLASGDAAPLGPAAERARAEALRLMKSPELRAEIAAQPELTEKLRALAAAA